MQFIKNRIFNTPWEKNSNYFKTKKIDILEIRPVLFLSSFREIRFNSFDFFKFEAFPKKRSDLSGLLTKMGQLHVEPII